MHYTLDYIILPGDGSVSMRKATVADVNVQNACRAAAEKVMN